MKKKPDRKFIIELGKRIRALREEQKITQSQLAFETGIRREQIIRIEMGKQSTGIDVLKKISTAFGVTLSEFFEFDR